MVVVLFEGACGIFGSSEDAQIAGLVPMQALSLIPTPSPAPTPDPELSSLTMSRENTTRHILEGRFDNTAVVIREIIVKGIPIPTATTLSEAVSYWLWFVDPDSFEITP